MLELKRAVKHLKLNNEKLEVNITTKDKIEAWINRIFGFIKIGC